LRLVGDLNDAEYKLATLDADTKNQVDALKAKISDIDEKLAAAEAHGSIVIRAPGAGVITDIVAKPGQVVKAGAPMLTIVPGGADRHAEMQVVLLAPSSAIGFVHTGQRVLLRYSAFPYQKFGEQPGTVISVARAALDAEQAKALAGAGPALEKDTAYYRVIVAPDRQFVDVGGERRSLPANMRVDAFALLDRRPLYQWILEPLHAFSRAAHQD
jgi:membrane fusion protein